MSIQKNLRALRLKAGMTQEEAAKKLGLTRQAVSSYETGRTRPDIDTLMRMAEVYDSDLDAILYGRERTAKTAHHLRITAVAMASLLPLLTLVSSALLWCAHIFFPLQNSQDPTSLATYRHLMDAWETMDGVILTLMLIGLILLLIFSARTKPSVPVWKKALYCGALAGALLLVSLPFGLTDPVFFLIDYWLTPIRGAVRITAALTVSLLMDGIQKIHRRANNP